MKKIVFIIPYYGQFPGYFREWAFSAGYLKEQSIDFLLITDIDVGFNLPYNIHVMTMSFEEFIKKAQSKFNFKLGLSTPYKLCDFKPALGFIFEEEIRDYDFWGNCDIDQIWGNVRGFITDDILTSYDRIQFLGHFILYRNDPDVNKMFMLPGAIYDYKKVLADTMMYSFCEHSGMMKIVVENNISNYLNINYADISPRFTRMIISRQPNYTYQIILWEDGHVYRYYINKDNEVDKDEYMYFHFQKKNPKSLECWEDGGTPRRFIYNANGFLLSALEPITIDYIKKYADYKGTAFDKKENRRYILKKVYAFIKSPLKKKVLWVKQRMGTREVIKHKEYFGENYHNV